MSIPSGPGHSGSTRSCRGTRWSRTRTGWTLAAKVIGKNNKDYFFHKDSLNKEGMAAVYYVNTNNGATVFGDGRAVESKENRLVVFPITLDHGVKRHTSGSKVRVVINFNWLPTV